MKITFILKTVSFAGGVRVVATYAQRLAERGHQVCVISQPEARPTIKQQVKHFLKTGRVDRSRDSGASYLDGLPIEHRRLSEARPVVASDVPDADVVVATWWETAEWIAALPPSKGAKAYFIQGYETWAGQIPRVEATWRSPLHKITIARWLVDLAQSRYADQDVSYVPNSVDTDLFFAPSRTKQPSPTVGLVFSAAPFKGCRDAFAAIDLLRKRMGEVRLVMFGKDQLTADLSPSQPGTLTISPPQTQIRDIYAACDVWLCPSLSEGFSLPALEAMACRCPVVATRCGGPNDFVENDVNGYLVDVGDVQAMADRLEHVLRLDETDWKRMSDAALATATQYTWEDATDRFEAGLLRAIEKSGHGALESSEVQDR